jgi:hypothetical protein
MLMHRNIKKKLKNNVFFFKSSSHKTVIKVHSNFTKVTKRAMDIQDDVYLTPSDNRDDLVRRIVGSM